MSSFFHSNFGAVDDPTELYKHFFIPWLQLTFQQEFWFQAIVIQLRCYFSNSKICTYFNLFDPFPKKNKYQNISLLIKKKNTV